MPLLLLFHSYLCLQILHNTQTTLSWFLKTLIFTEWFQEKLRTHPSKPGVLNLLMIPDP